MASSGDISHSFTDLMTSLAVIFILLLVATLNNITSDPDQTKENIQNAVATQLVQLGLKIEQDLDDPNTLIVLLGEEKIKFNLDDVRLKEESKPLIGNLFSTLSPILCKPDIRNKIESVIIEGHADLKGEHTLNGQLHNFEISQGRAFSVMREAFVSIANKNPDNVECLSKLASALGRGATRL